MNKLLIYFLILIISLNVVSAADYYVDTNSIGGSCSDSNVGNMNNPFCSLSQAESVSAPGDHIYIREGIYRERLRINSFGTETEPIIYEAYNSEEVIIDGSDVLSGWTQCSSQEECGNNPNWENIYYTTLDFHTDKLFENNGWMTNAREPDFGYYNTSKADDGSISTIISTPSVLTQPSDYYEGALVEFQGTSTTATNDRNNLIYDKYYVTNFDTNTNQIYFNYTYLTPLWGHSFDAFLGEMWFYLRNKIEFIDHPGEWALIDYLSDAPYTIYFWPNNGNPNSNLIEVASRQWGISGDAGAENLQFIGIDVHKLNKYPTINYGSGFFFNSGAKNIIIQNCEVTNTQKAIELRKADGFIVNNCYLHDNYNGILIGSGLDGPSGNPNMNYIKNSEIGPNGGDGFQAYSQANITIQNNYIHNHLSDRKHSDNVQVRAVSGFYVINNTIHDGGQNFVIQDADNVVIKDNLIYNSHARSLLSDSTNNDNLDVIGNTFGFSYYSLLVRNTNTVFKNNIFDTGDHYYTHYVHDYIDRISYSDYNYYPNYVTQIVRGNPWTRIEISDWINMGFDQNSIFYGDSSFANLPIAIYNIKYFYDRDDIKLKDIEDESAIFSVGDIIEYANDGVVRTVIGVDSDSIKIDPPLPYDNIGSMWGNYILYWGTNTNIVEDYTPSGNVCLGSTIGSYIGAVPCFGQDYVECNIDSDCSSDECSIATCVNNNCVYENLIDGTSCSDDGNECTQNICFSGNCIHPNVVDGMVCSNDDGISCTISPTCQAGECIPSIFDNSLCEDNLDCSTKTCTIDGCSYSDCIVPQIPENLDLWLRFNGNTIDSSENVLDSNIIVNGGLFTTDRNGNENSAYSLDGVDDYIRINNFESSATNEGSYSFWINQHTSANNNGILTGSISSPFIYDSGSRYRVFIDPDSYPYEVDMSSSNYVLDEWEFYVITFNSTNAKIYLNGELDVEKDSVSISEVGFAETIYIGSDRGITDRNSEMEIDDIRIYNYDLSSSEVFELYHYNESNDSQEQIHDADSDNSGSIELIELNTYVQSWRNSNTITLANLIEAIRIWKQ